MDESSQSRRKGRNQAANLELGAEGNAEVERLLAVVTLGLCDALSEGRMTALEASDFFFVPAFLRLHEQSSCLRMMSALHEASELENVERLVPHDLAATIQRIRMAALQVLETLPGNASPLRDKWLRRLDVS